MPFTDNHSNAIARPLTWSFQFNGGHGQQDRTFSQQLERRGDGSWRNRHAFFNVPFRCQFSPFDQKPILPKFGENLPADCVTRFAVFVRPYLQASSIKVALAVFQFVPDTPSHARYSSHCERTKYVRAVASQVHFLSLM